MIALFRTLKYIVLREGERERGREREREKMWFFIEMGSDRILSSLERAFLDLTDSHYYLIPPGKSYFNAFEGIKIGFSPDLDYFDCSLVDNDP